MAGHRQVGIVAQLFRYPVKSMLGESLSELAFAINGAIGDRAYALREGNDRIATAKKWPNLLDFRAAYDAPPAPDKLAPVTITLPDGGIVRAADDDASTVLSTALGRPIKLERSRPDEHSRGEIDPQ